MIEIGRRGFFTGLAALVAAPAIIRVAPLMPISVRHMPRYVPASWLAEWLDTRAKGMELLGLRDLNELRNHAWSKPMADNWVNVNDYDPAFVRTWAKQIAETEYWFS
jgi:hypothetical protein